MEDQTAAPTKPKKIKKQAAPKAAPAQAVSAAPDAGKVPSMEELMATIKALGAKVAAGEEAAMKRVCKALNVDPQEVSQKEASGPDTRIVRCFVHYPVRINNTVYQGQVEVPYHVFEVLQEALGKRRQRLLRELTGNNYMLKELSHGGMAPVLVGQVDINGERIMGNG